MQATVRCGSWCQDNLVKVAPFGRNKHLFVVLSLTVIDMENVLCHLGITYASHATIDLCRETFHNRLINRNCDANWPPKNCDLTLLDYFLLAQLRTSVVASRAIYN